MPIEPASIPSTQPIQKPEPASIPAIEPPGDEPQKQYASQKEAIVLCGIGYPHAPGKKVSGGFDYGFVMSHRLKRFYGNNIKITVFEVFKGRRYTLTFNSKGQLQPAKDEVKYDKIEAKDYRYEVKRKTADEYYTLNYNEDSYFMYYPGITAKFGKADVSLRQYIIAYRKGELKFPNLISIKTVYDYICDVGTTAPGSIIEFDVFSHAYNDGSILVNTPEWFLRRIGGKPITGTKAMDYDGRQSDFDESCDAIKDHKSFVAAFDDTAFAMLWGCDLNHAMAEFQIQVMKSEPYKKIMNLLSSTKKEGKSYTDKDFINKRDELMKEKFQFKFNVRWDFESVSEFHSYLRDTDPKSSSSFSDEKDLTFVLDKCVSSLNNTYASTFSIFTGIPVVAAVPGTSTVPDLAQHKKFIKDQLMHVSLKSSDDEVNHAASLVFFKQFFSMGFFNTDEFKGSVFGRGYGIYMSDKIRGVSPVLFPEMAETISKKKSEDKPATQPSSSPVVEPQSIPTGE